jgi:hypothetical protein
MTLIRRFRLIDFSQTHGSGFICFNDSHLLSVALFLECPKLSDQGHGGFEERVAQLTKGTRDGSQTDWFHRIRRHRRD